jgi:hypothetical protein
MLSSTRTRIVTIINDTGGTTSLGRCHWTDVEPIVIYADHINMVKFASKEDNGYRTGSGHLRIMAQNASRIISSRSPDRSGTLSDGSLGRGITTRRETAKFRCPLGAWMMGYVAQKPTRPSLKLSGRVRRIVKVTAPSTKVIRIAAVPRTVVRWMEVSVVRVACWMLYNRRPVPLRASLPSHSLSSLRSLAMQTPSLRRWIP